MDGLGLVTCTSEYEGPRHAYGYGPVVDGMATVDGADELKRFFCRGGSSGTYTSEDV